jgi:hypothetical protein
MDVTLGYALQTLMLSIKLGKRLSIWAFQALEPFKFKPSFAQSSSDKKTGDIF